MCHTHAESSLAHNDLYIIGLSVSPRINKKGVGDLAGALSVKFYLGGGWYMCIHHLKSRCTETDAYLICAIYALCLVIIFWLSEMGGEVSSPPPPPLGPLSSFRGNTDRTPHIYKAESVNYLCTALSLLFT